MSFHVSVVDGVDLLVTITGAIDATKREMETLVRLGDTGLRLIVDLSGVSFIDLPGLQTLGRARDATIDSGGSFIVRSPSAGVIRALSVAQVDLRLAIED
jgi:anti-anti-sigma factor